MEKTVSQTRASLSMRIIPRDCNGAGTLFGGALLEMIDNTASISCQRFTNSRLATVSLDNMNFIRRIPKDNIVTVESFVSGKGTRSVEIFAKAIGEDLMSQEKYLAATCFLTFVVGDGVDLSHLEIKADSEESQYILQGYNKRRQNQLKQREANQELWAHLKI